MTVRVFLRDVGLVARFELAEAVRSKLLVVMVLLFVGGGALGASGFVQMVQTIEDNAAKLTGAPTTRRPGATIGRLRESRSYRDMLRLFLRSDEKAAYFAAIPPIVVFFGWISFTFTPWLILFTSAETIATEVASRAIRYSVLRTGRLPFALGKMAGQALIIVGVTVLSAIAFYLVAWNGLAAFEHRATLVGLLSYLPRVLVFALPFLAWAMCASMVTRSINLARVLSLGGAVGLAIVAALAAHPPHWFPSGAVFDGLRDLVGLLTPFGHHDGLAYPPGGAWVTDLAVCLGLTVLYFAAGFAVLSRRDL